LATPDNVDPKLASVTITKTEQIIRGGSGNSFNQNQGISRIISTNNFGGRKLNSNPVNIVELDEDLSALIPNYGKFMTEK
jgi:hypothetical protein